jgi:membrane protein implicated in regulation of membrane protease activity
MRPVHWIIAAGVMLALGIILLAGLPVRAQAPAADARVVDWSPLAPLLREALLAVLGAVLVWAAALFQRYTGITVERSHREALQTALANAIGLLAAKGVTNAGLANLSLGSPQVTEAVNYVIRGVPDAVSHFGLKPEDVAEKLLAKAGVMNVALPTTSVTPGP